MELRIFVHTNCEKASTVSCYCLTKQKGYVVLILLALESTGSVLIHDGTLGAGIRELKPGAVPPPTHTTRLTYRLLLNQDSIKLLLSAILLHSFKKNK